MRLSVFFVILHPFFPSLLLFLLQKPLCSCEYSSIDLKRGSKLSIEASQGDQNYQFTNSISQNHQHIPQHLLSIMASIQPFTISIPDADIQLLKQKLSLSRFPDEPEDAGWSQGAPLNKIKSLAQHWEHSFDWRKAEVDLNTLPQFITKIEAEEKHGELDLHFVHAKSKVEGAIPLLFVHGCG